MDKHAVSILQALSTAGIDHDAESLSKHHSQGLISSVYTITTPQGDLIIHISKLTSALEHFRVWEKLKPVSEFLCAIPGVPAAEVFLTVKWPQHFLAVQRKLPGHSAGLVELKEDTVLLTWKEDPARIEEQLEDIMAKVHGAPLDGFGPLVTSDSTLRGRYDSWKEFLERDIPVWIDGIAEADHINGSAPDTVVMDARNFLEKIIPRVAPLKRASLVSCDAMNPSNILVENGRVTGIVDWEWALAADPAWEFSYMNSFSLKEYFSHFPSLSRPEDRQDFLERVKIYEYLLYVMWCFAVSGEPQGGFYKATRTRLKNKLAEAENFLDTLGLN